MNKDGMAKELETAIGKALGLTYEDEKLPFTIHTRNYLAKELVKNGYRKVGEDEQVVKKDQLIEMLNSTLESGKRMGYAQGRNETARDVLQELKEMFGTSREFNRIGAGMGGIGFHISDRIEQFAKEKGIELE